MKNKVVTLNEYIQGLNTNSFYSGEIEVKLISDIFNIDILILEDKCDYKGYIQYTKINNNTTNKIKPIMILNYSNINGSGHYNIMHIKKINNIKENIKTIPNYIDNKYNYDCLRKYNVCRFLLSNKSANLG